MTFGIFATIYSVAESDKPTKWPKKHVDTFPPVITFYIVASAGGWFGLSTKLCFQIFIKSINARTFISLREFLTFRRVIKKALKFWRFLRIIFNILRFSTKVSKFFTHFFSGNRPFSNSSNWCYRHMDWPHSIRRKNKRSQIFPQYIQRLPRI